MVLAGFVVAAVTAQAAEPVAVLQGLDKITARVTSIQAPIDRPVKFGALQITVRTCQKRPPEEPPETTAFLEIVETKPDGKTVSIFSGWMLASSPALNALENPVYDVWVIDCSAVAPSSIGGRR